ncbi:MAG: MBL fold metallo-hydrolase [Lachnospiraceae bacterium]|nr:MBL fold metallo-hydrolase [Lachnospiraceae bacterium]
MSNIKVARMVVGNLGTNCYLIYREESKEAIIVDPADCGEQIFQKLQSQGFTVSAILLTHAHFDHVLGASDLRRVSGAKLYALEEERPLCENSETNVSAMVGRPCTIRPNTYVVDGQELELAGMTCKVIATPGHTAGSCCYYFEEAEVLICGDTIFQESVGRTDLPTGSASQLVRSIRERIFTLPEETQLFPGHGDSTTVGHEKKYNPFC